MTLTTILSALFSVGEIHGQYPWKESRSGSTYHICENDGCKIKRGWNCIEQVSFCDILPFCPAPWILISGCVVSLFFADWQNCQREPKVRTMARLEPTVNIVGQWRGFTEGTIWLRVYLTWCTEEKRYGHRSWNLGFSVAFPVLPLLLFFFLFSPSLFLLLLFLLLLFFKYCFHYEI